MVQAWKGYCEFKCFTFRNCQHQKEQWNYIKDNWSNRYKTGQQFDLCRRLCRDLKDLECYDQWQEFFGKHSEFPEGESLLTVVQNMQAFTNQLSSNFLSSYPPAVLAVVCMEGCKFMAQVAVAGDDARHLPDVEALFSKFQQAVFERLKVPVVGAAWVDKVFRKKNTKSKENPAGPSGAQEATSTPKSKAKTKAKGKAKAKAKSSAAACVGDSVEQREDVLTDVKMDMADCRQKWWLDDLIGCLVRASGRCPDSASFVFVCFNEVHLCLGRLTK